MSKTYTALTLGELIDRLEELGDAPIRGLDGKVHSYRGYYERNCTEPASEVYPASTLANAYRKQVGKDIHGWKGGDYNVSTGELIYYAERGNTGPAIAALERVEDGAYELICVEENFW